MAWKRVSDQSLRWQPERGLQAVFKSPDRIKPTEAIVGQRRAVEALKMGLKLYQTGFNVYVAGMAGTGRMTTIRRALKQLGKQKAEVPDRCYVYNFLDPSQPVLLTFPCGKGRSFRDDMSELVRVLRAEIPKAVESPHVQRERELIIERYQREEKRLFEDFAEHLKKEGFALVQLQEGGFVAPTVFPIVGNEAVSIDYLDNLVKDGKMTAEERDAKNRRYKELMGELKRVLTKARSLGKEMHLALDRLMQRSGSAVLDGLMDDLRGRYADEKVRKYLLRVKGHILKNLDVFVGKREDERQQGVIVLGPQRQEDHFWYYEVNLLYDQTQDSKGDGEVPIVEESNPSYVNIFGATEYNIGPGNYWTTDFRHIKAGSLLRADGGYIIVNALDILRRPIVWDMLKRVLKKEELIIQQPESYLQFAPLTIKPEPIKLSVKVIMVGPSWLYRLLYAYEEDFAKTFKVLADFDVTMPLSSDSIERFASVLRSVCGRGKLKSFSPEGLVAMVEYGIEEAGQRDRISTRFSYITDVLREADYWAGQDGGDLIERKHVERAIDAKRERHRLTEEHVQRLIEEGVILIDSKGTRIGQINGLSVYQIGHVSFGKPSRVTATTAIGKDGVINIEREAKMSGPTHDKGVYILTGYLRHKYSQREPLNLTASLCFEQSYGGIDGDSASSTEIYCILSSLSGAPIRQDLAVTGSVNQLGDIQPIGGVNEKIEGFYDVCKAQGLTGTQGVMIPVQNERHLMLRKDVAEAVRKGRFHIYSVANIDDGIELLMGRPAGKADRKNEYPVESVHGMVVKRLREMNESIAKLMEKGVAKALHDEEAKDKKVEAKVKAKVKAKAK
ncbi:MAG: AAA family ATPase, partial [Proteobacteria bacterium]|nr:AAA family ATPase [Pseudomonadota bacterium]